MLFGGGVAQSSSSNTIARWYQVQKTMDQQVKMVRNDPVVARDLAYFRENIGKTLTADDVVGDVRLRNFVAKAFGLDEFANATAFLRKAIEEGTDDPRSFANRLADPRFREMSSTLGHGNLLGARTWQDAVVTEIETKFVQRTLETRLGEESNSLRMALYFQSEITALAGADDASEVGWLKVMGSPPLRSVIEGGFALPSSTGKLPLDQQQRLFENRSQARFGDKSLKAFLEPRNVERIVVGFLARSQLNANGSAGVTTLFGQL